MITPCKPGWLAFDSPDIRIAEAHFAPGVAVLTISGRSPGARLFSVGDSVRYVESGEVMTVSEVRRMANGGYSFWQIKTVDSAGFPRILANQRYFCKA